VRQRGPLRAAATIWRRSIQARVVISTLLLSAVVVTLVGVVLMRQITHGLVENKTQSSVTEAARGTADAQSRLSAASGTDFDSSTQLAQLASSIVSRGAVQGYDVVLTGPIAGTSASLVTGSGTRKTPGVDTSSVPQRLRTLVEDKDRSGIS
jgi:two-component system, OmpR family, sensor histidine kinase MtrB